MTDTAIRSHTLVSQQLVRSHTLFSQQLVRSHTLLSQQPIKSHALFSQQLVRSHTLFSQQLCLVNSRSDRILWLVNRWAYHILCLVSSWSDRNSVRVAAVGGSRRTPHERLGVAHELSHFVTGPGGQLRLHLVHHCLESPRFLPLRAPLPRGVQRVQEGVERRVERQHEDGRHHVDLARDGRAPRRQQPHHAHREPAAEVGEDDEEEAARDGGILPVTLRPAGHGRVVDGPVDARLAGTDQHEEDKVEADEDGEGVGLSGELLACDGQRQADAGLTVELPVPGDGQQRDQSQQSTESPGSSTSQGG